MFLDLKVKTSSMHQFSQLFSWPQVWKFSNFKIATAHNPKTNRYCLLCWCVFLFSVPLCKVEALLTQQEIQTSEKVFLFFSFLDRQWISGSLWKLYHETLSTWFRFNQELLKPKQNVFHFKRSASGVKSQRAAERVKHLTEANTFKRKIHVN